MTFHAPIGVIQWQKGKRIYKGFRSSLRGLRRDSPPRSADEFRILRQYIAFIQKFGQELLKPRDKMNAGKMNQLNDSAVLAFIT